MIAGAVLALALSAAPAVSGQNPPRLLHVLDFETGNLDQWPRKKLPSPDSAHVVTDPVRSGRYAAEFVLRRSDPMVSDGKRAELQVKDVGEIGKEYWYGFSTMVPGDWKADSKGGEVVAQWKSPEDSGESKTRSPVLALRIIGDKWQITSQADPSPVTKDPGATVKTVIWKGKFSRGRWTDWVFHVRWSLGKDGLVEVWKDGARVTDFRGPNTYNDKGRIYFKIGLYKPSWNDPSVPSDVDVRHIFHDEVRIGDQAASYRDVAPAETVAVPR